MCDFHLIRGLGWQAIQNSCAGIRIKIQFGHVINALFEKAVLRGILMTGERQEWKC